MDKNTILTAIMAGAIGAGSAILATKSIEPPKPPVVILDMLAKASPECRAMAADDCNGVEPQQISVRMGDKTEPEMKWACKGGVLPEKVQDCLDLLQ